MIGCNVEKKTASGCRVSAIRLRHVTVSDVLHGPAQAAAAGHRPAAPCSGRDDGGASCGILSVGRVGPSAPVGPGPAVGVARVVRAVARLGLGLVAGEAQEDVVEARLAQGQAATGIWPRRARAAPRPRRRARSRR